MLRIESPIQNHILSKLKNAASLRYSDMQQEGVPNDLYNYHLQFLVKKGFVTREGDGYSLASKGAQYVADAHAWSGKNNCFFKLNVIMIVTRRVEQGGIEVLNQVRRSHPSFGKVGVPGGVVYKEEPIVTAASRKLKEETGLMATFRHVGMERRVMYREGDLFSDVLFPICYADAYTGTLREDTDYGHNIWVPLKEAIINESASYDSIPSIITVLKAVQDGRQDTLPFFFAETTQSDDDARG